MDKKSLYNNPQKTAKNPNNKTKYLANKRGFNTVFSRLFLFKHKITPKINTINPWGYHMYLQLIEKLK